MPSPSYVSPSQLRAWLEAEDPEEQVVVVDCRDEDRAGGHIPGSRHCPSMSFRANVGYLLSELLAEAAAAEPEAAAGAEGAEASPGADSAEEAPATSSGTPSGGDAASSAVTTPPAPRPLRVVFHCMYSQSRGPSCASIFQQELVKRLERKETSEEELRRVNVSVLSGGFLGWQDAMPDLVEGRAPRGREVGPRNFYVFKG